jgi:hypothetical protein
MHLWQTKGPLKSLRECPGSSREAIEARTSEGTNLGTSVVQLVLFFLLYVGDRGFANLLCWFPGSTRQRLKRLGRTVQTSVKTGLQ